jgi:hypothetical protein
MPPLSTMRSILIVIMAAVGSSHAYATDTLPIGTIQLRMDPTDAAVLLRKDRFDKSSFAVTVIDGDQQLNGRIKTSGSASRSFEKRSFTIKLDKGSKWHGQSRISLNGMGSDPTLIRNRMAWDIFHSIGVAGPQTAYHRVFLNGKPQGIYLQVEWIDGKMFERNGLGGDGELYHPQDSNFCGDLDKKAKYDIDDCWYKFSPPFDDYSSLTDLVNGIDATPISDFDKFMDKHFDVDSVINWLAVNVLVANGDTYNKNYFLYRSKVTGKWSVVPWDYDLTFGRTFDAYLYYPESVFNDRFMYFYPPELGAYNPLKEKAFRNPVLLSRFQIRLAHLMGLQEEYGKPGFGIFSYKAMSERIELLKTQLLPEVRQDPYLRNKEEFVDNVEAINHFVLARTGYLKTSIFGYISWDPELAFWRPALSPPPRPYPEKLQATAQGSGTVTAVADGFGYLLAVIRPANSSQAVSLSAESRFGQPPHVTPPGANASNCIQRTWFVTLNAPGQMNGSLTLEYLQENSRRHELGNVKNESLLELWRYDEAGWQKLPAHINTLANTLTTTGMFATSQQPVRFVACLPESQTGANK